MMKQLHRIVKIKIYKVNYIVILHWFILGLKTMVNVVIYVIKP